ncbi:MAG: F0F1 ATP synthase subunit A [Proteobacteria bacterium]|nr:F0F1 ATP synthase subunit A [Pseudomonadota bacterium]
MNDTMTFKQLFFGLLTLCSVTVSASTDSHDATQTTESDAPFDPREMIMEHVMDSHSWHIMDWNNYAVSVPLPVILWTEEGLVAFSSSKFHHDTKGHHVVEAGGQRFVNHHEKIYYSSQAANHDGAFVEMRDGLAVSAKPVDMSITKTVASLLFSAVLLMWIFFASAKNYRRRGSASPRGIASFTEPLIVFVRDDIAKANIGKHYLRFVPMLLTMFFFIWLNNLMGLIPFFPFGANVTGNIAVTLVLAVIVMLVTNVNGKKAYWQHIFWMPGIPGWVKPLLSLVEFIGIFTKPFSLMIRLFANITAGHIIVLSLVSLVFIFETAWVGPASVLLTLFISILELLVAALQAYIFTLLTALYIGTAMQEDHH